MRVAADRGYLQLCKYLRAEGCAWDTMVCFMAAEKCHLDTLHWLHESGCPWNYRPICREAAVQGHIDVLTYMQQQPESAQWWRAAFLTEMLQHAGRNNQLAAAKWLRERGAQWPDCLRLYSTSRSWSGDVLAWARAEGCTAPL
jgi:Ankyrin repeats (many copies)